MNIITERLIESHLTLLKAEAGVHACAWHKHAEAIDPDSPPGCQRCGCLLATRSCDACGQEFLDWSEQAGDDDIIRRPYFTSSGDLYCSRCGRRSEEAEEKQMEEEWSTYPHYPENS